MSETNDELRLRIAKAKGLRVVCIEDDTDLNYSQGVQNGMEGFAPLPDWPVDIAAAWKLVEEMRTDHLMIFQFWPNMPGKLTVELSMKVDDSDIFLVTDTAPRAISLAYIAWKQFERGSNGY